MTSITTYSSDEETQSPTPDTSMLNSPPPSLCGPKSWKENKKDMGYDEELAQIYEGREGLFQEGFGRIDGVTTQVYQDCGALYEFDVDALTQDLGSDPIQSHHNASTTEPIININAIIESNSIRIPNKGPDRQDMLGLVRCVAEGHKGNKCGLCNGDYCQEQAGRLWYPLFGWEYCHQKCWVRLCENYHQHLEEYGSDNTTLNFIYFVPVPR